MRKLLFVTTTPFYPQSSGGAEQSMLYLFRELAQAGWRTELICALLPSPDYLPSLPRNRWQIHRPPRPRAVFMIRETALGFPCWRLNAGPTAISRWLDRRLERFRPDVVLGQLPQSAAVLSRAVRDGHRSIAFIRDTSWIRYRMRLSDEVGVIANSSFAASEFHRAYGRTVPVLNPFVEPARFRARRHLRRYVTFINPVREKGLRIALEVARRLPEVRFLIVRGKCWCRGGFRPPNGSLPNVEVWDHQQDMRRVYGVTDILLVPSQVPESFGRVILEAHMNGIPVVASTAGGIPDTLGRGGLLVSPKAHVHGYVSALRRIRSDPGLYRRLSAQALENSRRPEFQPRRQLKQLLSLMEHSSG